MAAVAPGVRAMGAEVHQLLRRERVAAREGPGISRQGAARCASSATSTNTPASRPPTRSTRPRRRAAAWPGSGAGMAIGQSMGAQSAAPALRPARRPPAAAGEDAFAADREAPQAAADGRDHARTSSTPRRRRCSRGSEASRARHQLPQLRRARLRFRSADLAVKVCDYCHSTIVREGEVLENVGKAAEVPEDVSPLQLGVRGRDGQKPSRSSAASAGAGPTAPGTNGASCSTTAAMAGWARRRAAGCCCARPRPRRRVGGVSRRLASAARGRARHDRDARRARIRRRPTCRRSMRRRGGRAALPDPIGTTGISIDLDRPDGRAASLQTRGRRGLAYAGRYVTLAEIAATGLREFEGWPMPRSRRERRHRSVIPPCRRHRRPHAHRAPSTVHPLNCPNCGGTIALRAAGQHGQRSSASIAARRSTRPAPISRSSSAPTRRCAAR